VRRLALVAAALLCVGCGGNGTGQAPAAAAPPALRPVALPDMARVDASVQAQWKERFAQIDARKNGPPADLGAAYGGLGMLLQAGEYYEAAEPAYLNGEQLAPTEMRWPYYLGHLYKSIGQPAKAEAAYQRALALRPNDLPTLVWLGRLLLDAGRPDEADPLFRRAQAEGPRVVAVLAGLGQVALARRNYAEAVTLLEQAIEADPSADNLRSPLAAAYRGLGRTAEAEAHLKQWRNTDVLLPDPLKEDLDILLESGLSYEVRGVRALQTGDHASAREFFRKGLALTKQNSALRRSLQHKLGTALYMTGHPGEALDQFEGVIDAAPKAGIDEPSAKAHYSMGVFMASSGQGRRAIQHLDAAVRYQPNYIEARQALGDALRLAGQFQRALEQYGEAVRIAPRRAEARFGYAMSLIRLGRYLEARDWLEESVRSQPDRPELAHALARILAAAPDASVRDGQRALAMVQEILKTARTLELGATLAMALAEVGNFQEAVAVQRGVIDGAKSSGIPEMVRGLTEDLRLYERSQACRRPWKDDDPANRPGPPLDQGLAAIVASRQS
jgi:tetratricopeptide (TPR) repeat protein